MTAPEGTADEVLLVAVVEMADGQAPAGQQYEDDVLTLLGRHGGALERRLRGIDGTTEVQVIRFGSRHGLESFLTDPDRLAERHRIGDAVPATRVIEARDVQLR